MKTLITILLASSLALGTAAEAKDDKKAAAKAGG